MNRFWAAATRAAYNVSASFTWYANKAKDRLSLVAPYLSHLLWLISSSFRDLAQQGYGSNSAVYACLRLLASSVPEPPLVAYARRSDGEPGEPLAYNHPLRALIRTPNPLMTEFEFWELVTLHVGIGGKSYWFKERNNAGQVIGHWPLRPDRIGPIYAGPADKESVLLGWSYQVPGTAQYVPLPRRDVLAFNFPDPMGESGGIVEGIGPLQVLAAEVSADNEATRYVGTLLHNYAMPGVILQVKSGITRDEDARLIKSAFMRDFGGARRGQPAVVDKDTTVSSLGFSLKDLEFRDLRKVSESRIAAAFGVPAILVGLLVGLEAGIRATIAEQREFFAETTLATYWRRFSDQYTADVASEFGVNLVCRFDLTKVKSLIAQIQAEQKKITDAYINEAITKNEYRATLGFPPRGDGDCYIRGIATGRGVGAPEPAAPVEGDAVQDTDDGTAENAA